MSLDCEYCGERKTFRRAIIEYFSNRKGWYEEARRYRLMYEERLSRDSEDKRLLIELAANYRELASCYRSMQESIGAIRNIYSEMDKRVKKMKAH